MPRGSLSGEQSVSRPEDLRGLSVVLTSRCNLACSYCYQNVRSPQRMHPDILRAALGLLARSRRREVSLALVGGEPLLEFEVFKDAVESAAKHLGPRKKVRLATSTNGTLLDAEKVGFLATHRVETQVSFDGVREAQDYRGPGTFTVLDQVLERMRGDYPAFMRDLVTVALTVHPATLRFLATTVTYLIRASVRRIAITPINTHDPTWRIGSLHNLDREVGRVFRVCLSHYRQTGEVPVLHFRRDGATPARRPRRIQMCGVGAGERLTVDVDGSVHGCVLFASSYQDPPAFLRRRFEAMRLGNVRSRSLPGRLARYERVARAAIIFDNKQDKFSSYDRCRTCRYLTSCSVCPVSIGNIPGNPDPNRIPDFVCAWNKVILKYRERFPIEAGALDLLSGQAFIPHMMGNLLVAAGNRDRIPGWRQT